MIKLQENFPWIRSTDSAKPLVYALNGVDLTKSKSLTETPPPYPKRPERYFDFALDEGEVSIAKKNIGLFKRLAGDR